MSRAMNKTLHKSFINTLKHAEVGESFWIDVDTNKRGTLMTKAKEEGLILTSEAEDNGYRFTLIDDGKYELIYNLESATESDSFNRNVFLKTLTQMTSESSFRLKFSKDDPYGRRCEHTYCLQLANENGYPIRIRAEGDYFRVWLKNCDTVSVYPIDNTTPYIDTSRAGALRKLQIGDCADFVAKEGQHSLLASIHSGASQIGIKVKVRRQDICTYRAWRFE